MRKEKQHAKQAIAVLIVLFFGIALLAAGQKKEVTNKFTVSPDSYLFVENINGDIVINSWNKNEVYVNAKMKADDDEGLANTYVKMEQLGNEVRIEVKYKHSEKDGFWAFIKYLKHMGRHKNASVDFDIKVPKQLNLKSIDTVNGDVRISKIDGDVNVETVNGEIEITEASRRVSADTVNGSVEVSMSELNEDVNLETVNGRIRVYLRGEVNADVRAENLNGSIKTDFPLTISGKIAGKELDGKIGRGGNRISCETINGSIQILKLEAEAK